MPRFFRRNCANTEPSDPLLAEQTKLLYASLPTAITINAILALVVVSVQIGVVSAPRLFIWLAVIGAILLGRTLLALTWRSRRPDLQTSARCWLRRFRIGVIATGLAWGGAVIIMFPAGDRLHQEFLAVVLAGLTAGSITALSIDRVSTFGYLVPVLIPLMARFALVGNKISWAISAMLVVFFLALLQTASRAGQSLRENFRLRFQAVEQQQILRQSEARLNQAQRSAQIGNWETDVGSHALYWSDEVYRIFECDKETFTPTYEAFLAIVHPEDRDRVNQAYLDTLSGQEHYDVVHRLQFPDGRIKFVRERCESELDSAGKVLRSIGTVQDITQQALAEKRQRESEKKYRLLFESSRDALMISTAPSWKFTSVNCSTLKMFGVESEDEFRRLAPWDISPEHQPDGTLSKDKAVRLIDIALREGSNFFEWTHKRLDGSTFPTEVLLSPAVREGQTHMHATVRDIADRKRMESEIRERRHEMDALQKSQVAALTAAAIAHELNQPLLAVASYSEAALLLMNSPHPDMQKLREDIEGSERQALRAGQSLRHLLDYLNTEKFPSESFDLNEEIVDALNSVRSEHGLQFRSTIDLEPHLPLVRANRIHVRKALFNLLYNAVEAMEHAKAPAPAIVVKVRTRKGEQVAELTVQDNGPGLRKEEVERLFEPFFTTKPNGIGMGLGISRSLIEANGGQLWADPQEGPGATFHLTLPFAT